MLSPALDLTAAISLSDGSQGVLAGLLGIADWPETKLSLDGQGPLSAWQARLRAQVGELAEGEGELSADLADTFDASIALRGRIGSGLPALFGIPDLPETTVAAQAALAGQERLILRQLTVAAGASRVELAGTLHADGRIEQTTIGGTVTPADWRTLLPPDLSFAEASLQGTVAGTIEQPSANLQISLSELRGPEGLSLRRLACTLDATPGAPAWRIAGDCALEGAAGHPVLRPALGPAARLTVNGNLEPETRRIEVGELTLRGDGVLLEGRATASLPVGDGALPILDFTLGARAADIGALARALELPLAGGAGALTLNGRSADDGGLGGRIVVDAKPLWPPALGLPQPLTGPVAVSAGYRVTASQRLVLREGKLAVGALRGVFDGAAQLPDGAVEAKLRLSLPESERLALPLGRFAAGDSVLDLRIDGSLPAPRLVGAMRTPDLSLPDLALSAPRLAFDLRLAGSDIAGQARLDLALDGQAAAADVSFSLEDGDALRLDRLALRAPGVQADGAVAGRLGRNLWQGMVTLQAARLAQPAALFGLSLDGEAAATLTLDARDGRQAGGIDLRLQNLSWLRDDVAVLIDALTLEGQVQDAFGAGAAQGRLRLEGLLSPEASVSTARFDFDGDFKALDWQAELAAELQAPLTLSAGGTATLAGEALDIVLARLQGSLAGTPLGLSSPATLHLSAMRQELSGLALTVGQGRIGGGAALSAQALRGDLRTVALPLAPFIAVAAGQAAEGLLDLDAGLNWTGDQPEFDLQAKAGGLRLVDESEAWPSGEVAVQATWRGRALAVSGTVSGITSEPGSFEASLPLLAGSEIPEMTLQPDGPLSGSLQWRGELGPLLRLLPLSEHRFRGEGLLNLGVAGSVAAPRLTGEARLIQGQYKHLYWGTEFHNIELTADGDSTGSLTMKGTADDGAEGKLELQGAVALSEPDRPTGWLTVSLRNVHALARDELNGEVSADIRLEGDLEATTMSGETRVERMEILIPDRLPPSVVELQVEEIGQAKEQRPETPAAAGPETRLDLTVDMPARVFVRGRGLDSEWGGELKITGTSRKPIILGALQVIRGKFAFAGRSFDISTGTLRFRGGDEVDPEIEVKIQHARADLSAEITLSGPVSAPVLSLSSTPSLPDDEILARIVFGKSARELSPLQSLQLAQSVAEISGAVSGGGLMTKLRQSLGVDALTVDGGGDDGPKVGVGKYLLENVYVGVRQGATAGSGELAAEIELTPNLSLQSEIGQDARSNIDLNWHYDY